MIIPARQKFEIKDGGVVHTDPSNRKLSGTTLSGVVDRNAWSTPFSTACRLLNVYNEDISDNPAIKAGNVLEHVIVDYVNEKYEIGIIKGDDIFGEQPEDYNKWKSHFDDPDFSGHLDGVLADGTVVEIKTGSRPQDWVDKDGNTIIPENYHIQASLYARMTGVDKILFVFGHVLPADRSDPYKWEPEGNVYLFNAELHPEIDEIIEEGRDFLATYIRKGISPEAQDTKIDNDILDILEVQINADLQAELAEYIDKYNEEIREKTKLLDDAKDKLKIATGYSANGALDLSNQSGKYAVTVSTRKVSRVDNDLLKKEGIYDDYLKETQYQILTVKRY